MNVLLVTALAVAGLLAGWIYLGTASARPSTSDAYRTVTLGVYRFVTQLVVQQASRQALVVQPMMVWIFGFIAVANLYSLIPFAFTVNAHISVTLTLALALNLAFAVWGFTVHGLGFLRLFVPSGVPAALVPVIVVIEVISYSIRSFSLALRLFANLMAGHTLIHILVGFLVAGTAADALLGLAMYPAILAVGGLELGIAVLQAYVFVTLSCIYFSDALSGGAGH